jgi:hypothetical protein
VPIGGTVGGSIAMVVSAALNALLTDYRPLAQRAATVFLPPDGIPAGPYHPEFQKIPARFRPKRAPFRQTVRGWLMAGPQSGRQRWAIGVTSNLDIRRRQYSRQTETVA